MSDHEFYEHMVNELGIRPELDPDIQSFNDREATWVYWVSSDPKEIPAEWIWERLRFRRDSLLKECDFRVVADAPWDQTPWIVYREALRDLPDATTDPRVAVWPLQP